MAFVSHPSCGGRRRSLPLWAANTKTHDINADACPSRENGGARLGWPVSAADTTGARARAPAQLLLAPVRGRRRGGAVQQVDARADEPSRRGCGD